MRTEKGSPSMDDARPSAGCVRESGGWITGRQPLSTEVGNFADEFPDYGEFCPGNVRYVDNESGACWMGELSDPYGLMTLEEAHRRLFAAGVSTATICPSEVACALGDSGLDWSSSANPAEPCRAPCRWCTSGCVWRR